MDEPSKNELVGRLWLWAHSVWTTHDLLRLAFRANLGKNQDTQIGERDLYIQKLNDFVKLQPDYKPGTIFNSQQLKFDAIYPRPFPTWNECFSVHSACVELAIVYFCQILNDGYYSAGSVASNKKSFREFHLQKVLDRVFDTEDELKKFELLKTQIVTARDKMIGHADGDAYSITHGHPVSTMKGPVQVWREIDFLFWESFLDRMRTEIMNYISLIKLDLTAQSVTTNRHRR